ncbi:MAG: tetratricopeptide repeat protein [Bacteroidetes bacterium]|nr:tetratricopeptide repeat protein [Bacteroidota bacterium]
MNTNLSLKALLFLSLLVWACTPKTGSKTTETQTDDQTETEAPVTETDPNLSPCPNFDDSPDPQTTLENFVVYRNLMKTGDWNESFKYWKQVYEVAPAADGKRNTVLADGIKFYEIFAANQSDSLVRESYIDRVFELYDQIDQCYPEGGYIKARKAFDLYYKYSYRSTPEDTYNMFKASIDQDGLETHDFAINPFTALLVDLHQAEKVSDEEALKYATLILNIVDNGIENCEGEACDRWLTIQQYAPSRLEYFETVKDFYACEYYVEKYYPDFQENPEDCDVIRTVYSRFKWGGCPEDSPEFAAVIAAAKSKCIEETAVQSAYKALQEARYSEAIDLFNKAAQEETDNTKKAKYTLLIAKIYFSHLKNFSAARKYARDASKIRPNWGEPYLLIGRLYASSGPLCGPGRGWDSQIVTWPAIDKWIKAKSVDPSVASEANKLINTYTQYMPSVEDIFQRNLKEGQSFYVGCWIQESTTIRAAPRG